VSWLVLGQGLVHAGDPHAFEPFGPAGVDAPEVLGPPGQAGTQVAR